jgi:hypothetical protein
LVIYLTMSFRLFSIDFGSPPNSYSIFWPNIFYRCLLPHRSRTI